MCKPRVVDNIVVLVLRTKISIYVLKFVTLSLMMFIRRNFMLGSTTQKCPFKWDIIEVLKRACF